MKCSTEVKWVNRSSPNSYEAFLLKKNRVQKFSHNALKMLKEYLAKIGKTARPGLGEKRITKTLWKYRLKPILYLLCWFWKKAEIIFWWYYAQVPQKDTKLDCI